jgi:hypothetical protein
MSSFTWFKSGAISDRAIKAIRIACKTINYCSRRLIYYKSSAIFGNIIDTLDNKCPFGGLNSGLTSFINEIEIKFQL